MPTKPLTDYASAIAHTLAAGNATEHSYRPALKTLIEAVGGAGIVATNEPKRIECGAPDYIISRAGVPLGYIEAKDVGLPLAEVEKSKQLRRYLESLSNLVLTDYLEFRWFVGGEYRLTARLATVAGGKVRVEPGGADAVGALLTAFIGATGPTVATARELAVRMAALAQLMREAIARAFSAEDEGGSLHAQLLSFRSVLLNDLTREQFADMYAQTISYGLFAARCNAPTGQTFTREHAAYDLPKTNPFLRQMFSDIAGPNLDDRVAWAVDDLANLLAHADMEAILRDFGKNTRREDPVVHFYETFLREYDPRMREARGVYYTPEPVVSYIVRSVDELLKRDFKLADGLADTTTIRTPKPGGKGTLDTHRVLILDPAAGTGAFLHQVIERIRERFDDNEGLWSGYVSQHLLPRLFGFELLMAPYAVAHLKLGLQLRQSGYDFKADERLQVYLTNTLEEAHDLTGLPQFTYWLAKEANAASQVKREAPVMVVLGNPPYSGHSANKGPWIEGLLHGRDGVSATSNYFEVDGHPLGEKNPKWLNDDYVKFIRFAQWRIERTGSGILAFISNNGYLDNPTFRGMRQSLMHTFDDIHILDLHGNSKKGDRALDGGKDENVFDIQQGVAIAIFVKRGNGRPAMNGRGTVRHASLRGVRDLKYAWLAENDISSTAWQTLEPYSPFQLFVPQDTSAREEYAAAWSAPDIFPVHGWGIATRKDYLLVDFNRATIEARFKDIQTMDTQKAIAKYDIKTSPHWNFASAKAQMSINTEGHVHPVLFRPFDIRFMYYERCMIERGDHRYDLMSNMFDRNLSLITVRRMETAGSPTHFFATDQLSVLHSTSAKEGNFVFPLYTYASSGTHLDTPALLSIQADADTPYRPNLAPAFIADLTEQLGLAFIPDGQGDLTTTFGPEDVFHYVYAILHAPSYRARYAEFFKIDFPRIPLTRDMALFRRLCAHGQRLVALHLLNPPPPVATTYPVTGDNVVEAVRYVEPGPDGAPGRVWINRAQYFGGVAPAVWAFMVGGYQVCHKWLKDRKGRTLGYDDLTRYGRIVAALGETITVMADVDAAIAERGGWPLG